MTRRVDHTGWCAGGHHCALGEHRSDPLVVTLPGVGRAVLTRVCATTGAEHAEVRVRLILHPDESTARRQLTGLLHGMRQALTAAAIPGRWVA